MKKSLLVFCSFFALSIFAPHVAQADPVHFDLVRQEPVGDRVDGRLSGGHNCDTVEKHSLMIPAGDYEIRVTKSPTFGRYTPEIMNVPGRSGIRFHPGSNSQGCVLVQPNDEETMKRLINNDAARGVGSDISIR